MVRFTVQPVEQQGELKLEVFGKLSDQQREKLVEKYASIVPSAWRPRVRWGARKARSTPKPKGSGKEAAE